MKPKHHDACSHGAECYVGTFAYQSGVRAPRQTFDLYVYDNGGRQEICMRYGDGDSDYVSPGRTVDFIRASDHNPKYRAGVDLLVKKGAIVWHGH